MKTNSDIKKEIYTSPEMIISKLIKTDIITTSGTDTDKNQGEWDIFKGD